MSQPASMNSSIEIVKAKHVSSSERFPDEEFLYSQLFNLRLAFHTSNDLKNVKWYSKVCNYIHQTKQLAQFQKEVPTHFDIWFHPPCLRIP